MYYINVKFVYYWKITRKDYDLYQRYDSDLDNINLSLKTSKFTANNFFLHTFTYISCVTV